MSQLPRQLINQTTVHRVHGLCCSKCCKSLALPSLPRLCRPWRDCFVAKRAVWKCPRNAVNQNSANISLAVEYKGANHLGTHGLAELWLRSLVHPRGAFRDDALLGFYVIAQIQLRLAQAKGIKRVTGSPRRFVEIIFVRFHSLQKSMLKIQYIEIYRECRNAWIHNPLGFITFSQHIPAHASPLPQILSSTPRCVHSNNLSVLVQPKIRPPSTTQVVPKLLAFLSEI